MIGIAKLDTSAMDGWEIPAGAKCSRCGSRDASVRFSESLSAMDMAHGMYGDPWCRVCVAERQLEYARERAAEIPELEATLRRELEGERDA